MKLLRLILSLQEIASAEDLPPSLEFRITKIEAKETPKSYVWEGKRLNKAHLHQIECIMDDLETITYKTYTFESNLEEMKEKLREELQQNLLFKERQIQRLKASSTQEPAVRIREGY